MPSSTDTRPNQAPIKVVCLGLGRTGTVSLAAALETLGFGPSYHLLVNPDHGDDHATWLRIAEGDTGPEVWDSLLQNYQSIMDYPAAIFGPELYAAYPDARFILTVRDPAKWEESMKSSLLLVYHALARRPNITPGDAAFVYWYKTFVFDKYHGGRLETHTQQEFLDHNERIKALIPSHQLLVYDVSEGWDRLAAFLSVPKPSERFPHKNDKEYYVTSFFAPRQMELSASIE